MIGAAASQMYNSYYDRNENDDLLDSVLRKEEPPKVRITRDTPIVTYLLIAINVLIFGAIYLYSQKSGKSFDQLLFDFGEKENGRILSGEYWRFITPVFLHANPMHLGFNCMSIYFVGVAVEKLFGRFKFITVYLIAGIAGNIASFIFSSNPAVGASGAIFGLMGTLLYFGLQRPDLFRAYFGTNIIAVIVFNIGYGLATPGIDNYAHLGGLLGGFLTAGAVTASRSKKWYLNRVLYIVLIIVILISGLYYGFNNKQSDILNKLDTVRQYVNEDNWKDAERVSEDILKQGPKGKETKSEVLWFLSIAEFNNGKIDEALGHAKELVEIDPINGHYRLGIIYANTGRFEEARNELVQAKSLGADNSDIDELIKAIDMELGKQ